MTYKRKSRIIFGTLLALLILVCEYTYWSSSAGQYETKFVAAGKVESRFETDYSCGSKGRYTCYSRYFTINGVQHEVSDETFKKFDVGSNVTLTKEERIPESGFYIFSLFVHFILISIAAVASGAFLGFFAHWSVMKSDKMTFSEYLSK